MAATPTRGNFIPRTTNYDPDVLEWLKERGERLDRPVDWLVREILRAAYDAEQAEPARRAS